MTKIKRYFSVVNSRSNGIGIIIGWSKFPWVFITVVKKAVIIGPHFYNVDLEQ